MHKTISIISSLLLIAMASVSAAECGDAIKVTGTAELKVKPNMAYVTLYAMADGILMVDAVKSANELVAKITAAIKQEDKIIEKIEIENVSFGQTNMEYWRPNQQQEAPRPQVIKRIRIHCNPNPEEIYPLIDKAIRAGAVMQVPSTLHFPVDVQSIVVYGLENSDAITKKAKKMALDDARSKAEEVAKLAGVALGDIIGIGCSNISEFRDSVRFITKGVGFPTDYVNVAAEEIIVKSDISVGYEIIRK